MLSPFKQSNNQMSSFECSLIVSSMEANFGQKNSQRVKHLIELNQTNHENKHN